MTDVMERTAAVPGASDTDRAAWLAERQSGITATELRDLALGAITRERLADIKLGRVEDRFTGNAYTAWGNEREGAIAAIVRDRFGIEPESRVFHAADNSRKLASPDGLGLTFDDELLVCEIKTCAARYDLTPGSDDFIAKGYGLQVQWNLRVLGADRALFAWEQRIGTPGAFEVGLLQTAWIDRDERAIAALDRVADNFLSFLDARALEPFVTPDVDEDVDTHAVNYLRFLDEEKSVGEAKKREYDAILSAVGEREQFQQKSTTAQVTLTPMKVGSRTEHDIDAAKAAAPELWAALEAATEAWHEHLNGFAREVPTETCPRVTITAVKPSRTKEKAA